MEVLIVALAAAVVVATLLGPVVTAVRSRSWALWLLTVAVVAIVGSAWPDEPVVAALLAVMFSAGVSFRREVEEVATGRESAPVNGAQG